MHAMRSPGDSCLLTGFASGKLGLWVPPYPTRVGGVYTLVRHIDAHAPGPLLALNDGTQVGIWCPLALALALGLPAQCAPVYLVHHARACGGHTGLT